MDIDKSSLGEFSTGHDYVAAVSKQVVATAYARPTYSGITVRADTANTGTLYVGANAGVSASNGYQLPAGEEVVIPVDSPAKVWIMGVTAGNSIQVITLANLGAGSFWTLTYNGVTTVPLASDVAYATVQSALETILGSGNVTVSGNAGGPYTVTLVGALAKHDALLLTGEAINEVQTITLTNAIASDTMILSWGGNPSASVVYNPTPTVLQTALEGITGIGVGQVLVTGTSPGPYAVQFTGTLADTDVSAISGAGGTNNRQTISITNTTVNDTMVISFGGASSASIPYNLSAADMKTALAAIGTIASPNYIDVTKNGEVYVVTFKDGLGNYPCPLFSGVGGTNEVQTITVSGGVAGATMVLTCGANSTSSLAYNVSGSDLQTALRLLASIGAGNVNVSGNGPYACTFVSNKALTDMPLITGVGTRNEVQTVTVTGGYTNNTMVLTWGGNSTSALPYNETLANVEDALEALAGMGEDQVVVTGTPGTSYVFTFGGTKAGTDVSAITAAVHSNEVQTISLSGGVPLDTMVLTWDGHDTAALAYDITGALLQTALEGLPGIGAGQVSVTGNGPYVVTFTGTLADTNLSTKLITGAGTNLLTVDVVETHVGHSTTIGVVETYKGYTLTVGVVETYKGNTLAVGVVNTIPGNTLTVGVVETYKGDPDASVTSVISANASDTCRYNWISA
jgi:hypothetical protein